MAALASIIDALAAPGYFAESAIETAGAVAAWTAGAALQSITLAKGGEFTVPPGYPNDTYLMPPTLLTSGEKMKVTPAGQSGDQVIHVHNYLAGRVISEFVTRASRDKNILINARSVIR